LQNVVAPLLVDIVGVGTVHTVTVTGPAVPVQPPALVTVTLYGPAVVGEIDCVAFPLDQL
jgi:hypothetical protein